MCKKIMASLQTRGMAGSLCLAGSYVAWYWAKMFSQDRRFVRKVNGVRMILNLDDPGISTTLGRGGEREKEHLVILDEILKPGMRILDIGANLGYYALLEAVKVGPTGKVVAVEPFPNNFRIFNEAVKLNGLTDRVESFEMAMSNARGTQKLFVAKLSNLNTLYNDNSKTELMTGTTVDVKVEDIALFLKEKGPFDFMRMDIEGAEVEVLEGLARAVVNGIKPPMVLFETHRSKYNSQTHSIEKPLQVLFSKGYKVRTLVSNGENGHKWAEFGYKPIQIVDTDGDKRGIYSGVSNQHALELIANRGGVRAALLAVS